MKTVKWILLIALMGLIFGQLASAEIDGPYCCVIPRQTTDWNKECYVEQFDPSLGTLKKVIVNVESCGWQEFKLDSEDSSPRIFTVHSTGSTETNGPNVFIEVVLTPQFHEENLSADSDDAPDFIGNDSFNFSIDDCQSNSKVLTAADDIDDYVGVGSVTFKTFATGEADVSGGGAYVTQVNTEMESEVCVTYEYDPAKYCINGSKINSCTGMGIPGWKIELYNDGALIKTEWTNDDGDYSFCGLEPGNYEVCEETRPDWVSIPPICIQVPIVDHDVENINFANTPLFSISGHKFDNKTGSGLSDWTINLLKDGDKIKTTTTGTSGYYVFEELAPGEYQVCEVLKAGWKNVGPLCIDVTLGCEDSEDNDFTNEYIVTPPCGTGCPWFIKNELYTASCREVKEVDASKGILANDPAGTVVVDPESIAIDPKYGTIEVHEDGSFVYDPAGAAGLNPGAYVIFKYNANNGRCDAKYPGIAKIQIRC